MTLIEISLGINGLALAYVIWYQRVGQQQQNAQDREAQHQLQQKLYQGLMTHLNSQQQQQGKQSQDWLKQLIDTLAQLKDSQQNSTQQLNTHIQKQLSENSQQLNQQLHQLSSLMEKRLQTISGQVEQKLQQGFEKTTSIFQNVIQRLTIIDQAQKRIQDLSANVADLKTVFNDKRSRGAFGEVQLAALINNMIPKQHVSLQHTLSNGTRVDCLLKLPQPTGDIAIDAKFPLESFQKIQHITPPDDSKALKQQFRQDITRHIEAIAKKYIIPGETSDGALMFLPAEAIFADIHSHYPDLIELAQRKRVWIVSPTTMMAVLTTASAVLKDVATREQVHLIQKHLLLLQQDFGRFQKRMNQLAKHINQAQKDVDDVNISAQKISHRFNQIEQVELTETTT